MRKIQTKNENAADYASALYEIARGELPDKMLAERFCDGLEAEELRVKAVRVKDVRRRVESLNSTKSSAKNALKSER